MAGKSVRHGSILIVDDEPDTVESLKQTLEQFLKVSVVTAQNPKEALKRLRSHPVHLIVSDFKMPDMNGYEFLHEAQKIYPNVRLMLMTGQRLEAKDGPAPSHLVGAFVKPFNPAQVVQAIRDSIPTMD